MLCRNNLSADGIADSMRPFGHNQRRIRSSKIQTDCPFEIDGVFQAHFCRGSRVGMSSFRRRFQTRSDSCCANFHFFINVNGLELILGGILGNIFPGRKGIGVMASMSQGEDDTVVTGRAFINFNLAQQSVKSIICERVFDATIETIPDATKIWCIGGLEFPRYLVVYKKLVHRGAVECDHQFFFCWCKVRCVFRADFWWSASSSKEASESY